jgi:hypothetical protein
MQPSRVLIVANQTSTDPALVAAVRARAAGGDARFHLVVPATPRGLHRVVDPEDAGMSEAQQRLGVAVGVLGAAAGAPVCGTIGDANPLSAVEDAVNLYGADEIIISTLPPRLSRWLRVDVVSKIRALGVPVVHVNATQSQVDELDATARVA